MYTRMYIYIYIYILYVKNGIYIIYNMYFTYVYLNIHCKKCQYWIQNKTKSKI